MSVDCPSCGAANTADGHFCSRCGTALPAQCPRFGAAISPEARFCPSCGQPLAGEVSSEERKVATALFVDLVGSTALADVADPERVRSVLQAYFSLVSSIVQAWGGTVEKYIGDAVRALFGVPRVREDDAARAVSAAVEIVERFEDLGHDLEERVGARMAIRLGIDTGEVIAPTQVHPDRPMVTGDAVNVAARLQAAAEPGHVLVGDRTFESTRQLFRYDRPSGRRCRQARARLFPVNGQLVRRVLRRPGGRRDRSVAGDGPRSA